MIPCRGVSGAGAGFGPSRSHEVVTADGDEPSSARRESKSAAFACDAT